MAGWAGRWGPSTAVRLEGPLYAIPSRKPLSKQDLLDAPEQVQEASAAQSPEMRNALGEQKDLGKKLVTKWPRRHPFLAAAPWLSMLIAGNPTPALPPPVPFFLYNNVTMLHGLMGHCMKRKTSVLENRSRWTVASVDLRYNASLGAVHEFAAAKYFNRMMMTHPWRTFEPSQAEVFIIPIDIDPSDLDADDSEFCGPQMYEQHLLETLGLLFEQAHITKRSGADHFWMMSANYPERLIEKFAPMPCGWRTICTS
eukprot:s128_g26.t1